MAKIKLSRGLFATVDDEDVEMLSKHKWYATSLASSRIIYAATNIRIGDKQKGARIHRMVMGVTDPKIIVDHKNGDGLDCRKGNLRVATHRQNVANSRKMSNSRNEYKGVMLCPAGGKKIYWYARIKINGRTKYVRCASEIAAAIEYNRLATEAYGEFARLNIIPETNKAA